MPYTVHLPTIDEQRRCALPVAASYSRRHLPTVRDTGSTTTTRLKVSGPFVRSNSLRVASTGARSMVNDHRFASAIRARLGQCIIISACNPDKRVSCDQGAPLSSHVEGHVCARALT